MTVSKLMYYNITCPRCGSKIRMTADEYKNYCEAMEYENEIICMEKFPNEERERDCAYLYVQCPTCNECIPVTLSTLESDSVSFHPSVNVELIYGPTENVDFEKYCKVEEE